MEVRKYVGPQGTHRRLASPGIVERMRGQEQAMYTVAVQRELDARHFLIGGDWGPENRPHTHHYRLEVQLEGPTLDEHQYLVDIVEIESQLDRLIDYYRGKTLNGLRQFAGYNPSIERFARVLCDSLSETVRAGKVSAIAVKVWENDIAWAAYRKELRETSGYGVLE